MSSPTSRSLRTSRLWCSSSCTLSWFSLSVSSRMSLSFSCISIQSLSNFWLRTRLVSSALMSFCFMMVMWFSSSLKFQLSTVSFSISRFSLSYEFLSCVSRVARVCDFSSSISSRVRIQDSISAFWSSDSSINISSFLIVKSLWVRVQAFREFCSRAFANSRERVSQSRRSYSLRSQRQRFCSSFSRIWQSLCLTSRRNSSLRSSPSRFSRLISSSCLICSSSIWQFFSLLNSLMAWSSRLTFWMYLFSLRLFSQSSCSTSALRLRFFAQSCLTWIFNDSYSFNIANSLAGPGWWNDSGVPRRQDCPLAPARSAVLGYFWGVEVLSIIFNINSVSDIFINQVLSIYYNLELSWKKRKHRLTTHWDGPVDTGSDLDLVLPLPSEGASKTAKRKERAIGGILGSGVTGPRWRYCKVSEQNLFPLLIIID